MQLLYIDESGGAATETDQNHYVLGAVSVFEKRPHFLTQELDALCAEIAPKAPLAELHASAIFNGNHEPWASMERKQRVAILHKIYKYIAQHNVTLFGIAMHKDSFKAVDPVERTCEELALHFDAYMARVEVEKHTDRQLGLMIFDQSNHYRTLHSLLDRFKKTGTRFGKLKHMAEVPMFVDSKLSRVLQIADFVAYAVFRRYERGDSSFLDLIIPKFDESEGKLHGLLHLVSDYRNCYCPACVTRRNTA